MKKCFLLCIAACFCLSQISWVPVANKAVAQIAENHLTPGTKKKLKALLGVQSLVDLASGPYAEKVDALYKNKALWHFLNLPNGLASKQKFINFIFSQRNENIVTALYHMYDSLRDSKNSLKDFRKNLTDEQKLTNIAFYIVLMADVCQPTNFGSYTDDCGRNVPVFYNGHKTNLYTLWNSTLLAQQNLDYKQITMLFDKEPVIKPNQLDESVYHIYDWAFDGYQLNNKIHAEIKQNNKLDNTYYKSHISIIDNQIDSAGTHLASILNDFFLRDSVAVASYPDAVRKPFSGQRFEPIAIEDVNLSMGGNVKICEKVYSIKKMNGTTLVYLGASNPNQLLTIVLKETATAIADSLLNKDICVYGVLVNDRGQPEIIGSSLYNEKTGPEEMYGIKEEIKIEYGIPLVNGLYGGRFQIADTKFESIKLDDAKKYFQKLVTVCGKVYGLKKFEDFTEIYVGGEYRNEKLIVIIDPKTISLPDDIINKDICVSGRLSPFRGKPKMAISKQVYIKIE